MKTVYYGYYVANGKTYNVKPYEYTNLKVARKSMREITKGETFKGNTGHWWIQTIPNTDSIVNCVAEGKVINK